MTADQSLAVPPLPDPLDYCYEWDGPFGTRKFSTAPHNGRQCDRSVPLFTESQMRDYARAAIILERERATPVGYASLAAIRNMQRGLHTATIVRAEDAQDDCDDVPVYLAPQSLPSTQREGDPVPCPRGRQQPEPSCTDRHQCWEPCGLLGKSAEHARIAGVHLTGAGDKTAPKACRVHPERECVFGPCMFGGACLDSHPTQGESKHG